MKHLHLNENSVREFARYRYGTISRDSGVTGKGENNQKVSGK